jgi:hypothetical protein
MTALASLVRSFATLLTPHPRNARRLQRQITAARAAGLPRIHAFTRGLDLDSQAQQQPSSRRPHRRSQHF